MLNRAQNGSERALCHSSFLGGRPRGALLGDSTLVAWYRCLYAPRTGGAYDSHHRTRGNADRARRSGGCVAARGARAAAAKSPPHRHPGLFPSAQSADVIEPFQQALHELGYVDGGNIQVEYHSAEQRSDLAGALAADLVRRETDIIVALATPAAHAAKNATASIPIVISVSDALATGLVASLARPGGNLTGVSASTTDLAGKLPGLIRELCPDLVRIAFLAATNDPNARTFLDATQAAADSMGLRLQPLLVAGPEEFDAAFATMIKESAQGLIVQPLFVGHRGRLAELAARHHLPMIANRREFAVAGALAAYAVSGAWQIRRLAFYVDKILKGAKPRDLPVEQPTKFDLGRVLINQWPEVRMSASPPIAA